MMKKGWTTTKLMTIIAIVVIDFLLWVLLGSSLFWATGSIFGSLSYFITSPFLAIFIALLINKFGAVTFYSCFYFLIALPLPSIFPKIVNLIMSPAIGLTVDSVALALMPKRKKLFSFVGGFVYGLINCLEAIVLYFTIGLPGSENVPSILVMPLGLSITTLIISSVSGAAGYAGFLVYKKLENTTVVKRIQG